VEGDRIGEGTQDLDGIVKSRNDNSKQCKFVYWERSKSASSHRTHVQCFFWISILRGATLQVYQQADTKKETSY